MNGPYGLFEWVCENYGYEQLESGYAGKCHLCVDVRKHLVNEDHFTELNPVEFYSNV
jgi:hypothetical protein